MMKGVIQMPGNLEVCFVIMPFDKTTDEHTKSYWTKHFDSFLKPLIEENPAFEVRRSKAMRGDILKEIITALVLSHLVVADITDFNANVYWELGVRQSFAHRTVTIVEEGTKLPFDDSTKGTLFYYPKDIVKNESFRNDFKEAIQDCLVNPDRPDSQVLETLSGRGTLFEIFRRDEAIRRLDAVLSECNRNLRWMDKVVMIAQENQEKDFRERVSITERFGVSAIQLLTTNRYVNEDEAFYEVAEECLMWIDSMNGQLSEWSLDTDSVQKWLIKHTEQAKKYIKKLQAQVRVTQEKLSGQF